MKRDLDWSDVEADAERGEDELYEKFEYSRENLVRELTTPQFGHNVPTQFVEDFLDYCTLTGCKRTLMSFYLWYQLPSVTEAEMSAIADGLKAHRNILHMHLAADIQGWNRGERDFITASAHKSVQMQAEAVTSLINRLGLCSKREGKHLWCVLRRHGREIGHQYGL